MLIWKAFLTYFLTPSFKPPVNYLKINWGYSYQTRCFYWAALLTSDLWSKYNTQFSFKTNTPMGNRKNFVRRKLRNPSLSSPQGPCEAGIENPLDCNGNCCHIYQVKIINAQQFQKSDRQRKTKLIWAVFTVSFGENISGGFAQISVSRWNSHVLGGKKKPKTKQREMTVFRNYTHLHDQKFKPLSAGVVF